MCFIIDLPRLPNGQLAEMKELPEFGKELLHFLDAKGLNGEGLNLVSSIMKFDFSNTSKLAFVHSMYVHLPTNSAKKKSNTSSGGSHSGEAWKTTGKLWFLTQISTQVSFECLELDALRDESRQRSL